MKFGLTGDTHNNIASISKICEIFNKSSLDFVIHTGDITLPKSLIEFKQLEIPLIGIFGNNDQGDKSELQKVCSDLNFEFDDGIKKLLIAKKKITIVHDPNDLDESHFIEADIIVHGHTHRFRDEKIHNCFVFNPGECAGILKGKNSIGIVDICERKMEIIRF